MASDDDLVTAATAATAAPPQKVQDAAEDDRPPHAGDLLRAAAVREDALAAARHYLKNAKAASTWRAYAADWRAFEAWCAAAELAALPAEVPTVMLFIAAEASAGRSPSTINRRLAAIRAVHEGNAQPSPHAASAVRETLAGIRRAWATPTQKKRAALAAEVKRLVDACDNETNQGLRDRALMLVGFASALRRSELVALTVADLEPRAEGLVLTIRRSKTDQEAKGERIAILREDDSYYCPVEALEQWLAAADITEGALFRQMSRGDRVRQNRLSAQSVALIIKRYAGKAGLDPTVLAGHSLRRGFLTSAARNGAGVFKLAAVSRHKSLQTLREYVEDAAQFDDHAGSGLLARDEPV